MKFELPFATPSNNAVMRMHHRTRTVHHKNYTFKVWLAVGGAHIGFDKCKVTVTRHASRQLDWDNMGGGLKFLLDAMVKNKIIVDDNPKCIVSLDLKQEKCTRKEEKTVIEIKRL
jgi:Holliday junction resolvase RusA-like endonuclease